MKRIICTALSLAVLAGSGMAAAAELKVGYVDLQEALNSADAGKKAKEVFKGEVDRLQKEIDKQQEELKKMNAELENILLSDDTRAKKEKEYQEKLKGFKRFYQDSQEKLQEKDAQLTRKIIVGLREVIIKLGEEKGYTFILERGEGNLLYASKAIDLTPDVVKRFNELNK